ncbi:SH3 domain-containing protein [Nannocystis radixulma]|uniref:SH3 domain-containing protein n=1 Tax=Nannocystis radixulma TaxID=2995305 RepID=A0ABT5B3H7_9BACT|nr:SH3 domain-containing protein [Nannocystis radixulma]MDC0668033.1 SH3 domain-containing protein [Nannocystis radixulma]
MSEPVVGLNIRKEASSNSPKLGILPRGTRIEVGERSKNGKWAKIAKVIEGQIAPVKQGMPVDPAASTGWVFLGELDPDTGAPELDKVVVLDKPAAIKAGSIVGHLGEYQRYEDAKPVPQRGTRPLLHVEVFSGDDVPAFVERCRKYAETLPAAGKSLLLIESGALLVEPTAADVTIDGTQEIKADGASSGRWVKVRRGTLQLAERSALGTFSSKTNTYTGGLQWTGWFVGPTDNLRTKSEAEAKQKGYTRREVLALSGPPVWIERSALGENGQRAQAGGTLQGWSTFPLQVANAKAPEVTFSHVRSRSELEKTKADDRAVDDKGKKWWRVDLGATSRSRSTTGWVCEEGHAKVSWQSPWSWPGFEFVAEGEVTPADLMSRDLLVSGGALKLEEMDFKARADKVEDSALIQKIYEHIDANKDGRLDPQELKNAVKQPLLERSLSRIIAHYESEWGGEMSKWDELDPLMLDGVEEWKVEKQRIDTLRWWPEVAGKLEKFPADPTVHHIHPIALVANFLGEGLGLEEARVRAFLRMLRVGEGTEGTAGYERLFGGSSFIKDHGKTFADHPRIVISSGKYKSSAAGAYQVMGYTWDDPGQIALRNRYGITDFTPRSQDRYGVILVKHKRNALEEVKRGEIREAIRKCNTEWASLPGSPYGQPTITFDQAIREYEDYLEREQRGDTDLAIAPGDIDDLLR